LIVRECTGECCREFPLGGHDLLSIRLRAAKEGPGGDAFAIVSMVVPTGHLGRYGGQMFSCMHWDPETKRCTNYLHRPRMCSEFPYGLKCEHCQGGHR
jgi:Fe-S-cluster containining protein